MGSDNVRLYANSTYFAFTQQTRSVGWLTELMLSYVHSEFAPEKWLAEAGNVEHHKSYKNVFHSQL